jgi:hypothetical protein
MVNPPFTMNHTTTNYFRKFHSYLTVYFSAKKIKMIKSKNNIFFLFQMEIRVKNDPGNKLFGWAADFQMKKIIFASNLIQWVI